MSQSKVLAVAKDTVTRVTDSGDLGQGCGQNKRLYVGRHGSSGTRRNYDSYLQFTMNWTDVGRIISATLSLWTDDLSGGTFGALTTPTIVVRRLTGSGGFVEGNNVDEHFDSSDFTTCAATTTGQVVKAMNKTANALTDIDITAIVKAWAPASVAGGGKQTNHGIILHYHTDTDEEWSGWSSEAVDGTKHPIITLVYDLGPTTPNIPDNLSPVGDVTSIGAFQADFSDPRATDTLAKTSVEVYDAGHTGTAAITNVITSAGHNLAVNDVVYFTALTGGTGLTVGTRYYVRPGVTSNTFGVSTGPDNAGPVDITVAYTALTFTRRLWTADKVASNTEIVNARSNVVPDGLHLARNVQYRWTLRQQDQEGLWSPWSTFENLRITNTDPDPPTLTPDGESYDTLTGVLFRGGEFSDPDTDDTLLAFQVQLSAYPEGDSHWDDSTFILWDTGKRYVASDSTSWETPYGGASLDTGSYYWRARQWDNHDGVSDWTYAAIDLTSDFDQAPGSQSTVQIDPHAPWRIRIREMAFDAVGGALTGNAGTDVFTTAVNHGFASGRKVRFASLVGGAGLVVGQDYYVIASALAAKTFKVSATKGGSAVDFTTNVTSGGVTAVVKRGPGTTIAIIENAKSIGASIVYNSPGEAHFTLLPDHPMAGVIEPKQTHYGIDFYGGDGWRETFAGLVDDVDATETDAVFTCFDYLAMADKTSDERYFPSDPNRTYTKGGSHYESVTIRNIVIDQLKQITQRMPNSPLGFVTIGSIATMNETITIDSTIQPTLSFISGLLDSHRQGTGKRTRLEVRRTSAGGYEFVVTDDPGQTRDALRMKYGELVQGYRVIIFGSQWASTVNAVGRQRDGIRVLYKTKNAPGIDQTVFGHIALTTIMDNVADEHDLDRRALQAALHAGKLGKSIAIAIRTGVLQPLRGYDICDVIPVDIVHGVIDTNRFGSGYWTVMGVAWEGGDDASQTTTLTLLPREDTTEPDDDLVASSPISPQAEWQIGWTPPDPIQATSKYWLDQNTGIVYRREGGSLILEGITGDP